MHLREVSRSCSRPTGSRPGLDETGPARCLARSIAGSRSRIRSRFTPDLLPGDTTVYHQKDEKFGFPPGGVFSNIVVAGEINRGKPKAQAALLEVMSERRVTVAAVGHEVPKPFITYAWLRLVPPCFRS